MGYNELARQWFGHFGSPVMADDGYAWTDTDGYLDSGEGQWASVDRDL